MLGIGAAVARVAVCIKLPIMVVICLTARRVNYTSEAQIGKSINMSLLKSDSSYTFKSPIVDQTAEKFYSARIAPVVSTLPQDVPWSWLFFLVSCTYYLFSIISIRFLGPKAHLVGLKSVFDSRVIANYYFFKDAASVVNGGYKKVNTGVFNTEYVEDLLYIVVQRNSAI